MGEIYIKSWSFFKNFKELINSDLKPGLDTLLFGALKRQGSKSRSSNPKILAALYPNRGACFLIDSPRFIFPFLVELVYRRCQITSRECFLIR